MYHFYKFNHFIAAEYETQTGKYFMNWMTINQVFKYTSKKIYIYIEGSC